MPTESVIPPPTPPSQSPDINFNFPSTNPGVLKCSLCGVSGLASSSTSPLHGHEGIVLLNDPVERLCGGCVRAQDIRQRMEEAVSEEGDLLALGLGLRSVRVNDGSSGSSPTPEAGEAGGRSPAERIEEEPSKPVTVLPKPDRTSSLDTRPDTPIEPAQVWRHSPPPTGTTEHTTDTKPDDSVPIRILEVCKSRINSKGKGALHPGATFKGTQTSGRSAYEVEVKIAVRHLMLLWTLADMQDVNLAESTVSGYLSIQHLTDAHPNLTTFFTGEIIGPEYGFITGARFGASENDDMRHWGRFEQFRRPATRGDMVRPELFFRDPQPDRSKGETRPKDRDFMFLRIKERFLVPDHRVRDISGASFAGVFPQIAKDWPLTLRVLLCDDRFLTRTAPRRGTRTTVTIADAKQASASLDLSQNASGVRIRQSVISIRRSTGQSDPSSTSGSTQSFFRRRIPEPIVSSTQRSKIRTG